VRLKSSCFFINQEIGKGHPMLVFSVGKQSTAEIELVDVINKFDSDWPELFFRWQNVKLLKTSPVPLVGAVHP
jgi:hypothetical protein